MRILRNRPELYPGNEYLDVPTEQITFVGGKEGVFAVWWEDDICHMCAGDDGFWWEIGSYHRRWVADIRKALE